MSIHQQTKHILPTIVRQLTGNSKRSMATTTIIMQYKTLAVSSPKPNVFQVELNRPDRFNAINKEMWREIKECFENLSVEPECRAIVLSGAGKHFTAGIDLTDMIGLGQTLADLNDVARKGRYLEQIIRLYQDSMSSLEKCPKPVVAAIHSACIGAGIDMITASDIRYCSQDAFFSVKEVDIGMAADVGTLQRLPKIMGNQSLVRELCFTARKFSSQEALEHGMVSKVLPDRDSLIQEALNVAELIAQKSPIAVQTTKQNLIYSLNRTNQEGLDHIREMNKLNLQSEDLVIGATAQLSKDDEPPIYSKL